MSKHLAIARDQVESAKALAELYPTEPSVLFHLRGAVNEILSHLEESQSQKAESEASSRITEKATTDGLSAAATSAAPSTKHEHSAASETACIEAPTPLLQRLLGVLTEAERTAVDNCSRCRERLGLFVSSWGMHVQDVHGISSISQKPASKPSAEPASSATSSSPESSEPTPDSGAAKSGGWECIHEWRLGATMFEYCESCDARKPYPPAPEVQE